MTDIQKNKLFSLNDFIAGSVAGVVQVLVGQPFDLVKVRLQTSKTNNQSALEIAKNIYKNEGPSAFYKGTLSPLVGISFCVAIQFGALGFAKNLMLNYNIKNKKSQNSDINLSVIQNVMAGAFAGLCNGIIVSPVELFRIQMQTQKLDNSTSNLSSNSTQVNPEIKKEAYTGAGDCAKKIYNKYGLKGVYHGFGATLAREIPAYGVYFGVYETLINKIKYKYNNDRKQVPLSLTGLFGAISGVCLWVSTYPIDIVKSVIQAGNIDSKNTSEKLTMANVARNIYRQQGISGFFKGLAPCLARAPFANAATFLTYEIVAKRLK